MNNNNILDSTIPSIKFENDNPIIQADLALIDKQTKEAQKARDKLLLSDETLTDLTSSIVNGSAVIALVMGTVALLGVIYLYCKLSKLQSALAILTLTRPTVGQSLHTIEAHKHINDAKTAQTLTYITTEITSVHQLLIVLTLVLIIITLILCMKKCRRVCQCPAKSGQYKLIARLGSDRSYVDVTVIDILRHHNSHLGMLLHNVDLANATSLPWTIVRAGCQSQLLIQWRHLKPLNINSNIQLEWPDHVNLNMWQYHKLRKILHKGQTNIQLIVQSKSLMYVTRPLARGNQLEVPREHLSFFNNVHDLPGVSTLKRDRPYKWDP
jgi:hypothetical protein